MKTTLWTELSPTSPYYLFVPREEKGRETYEKYWKITDIFPINVTGIVTARDGFVIDFDREVLKRRITMFRNLSIPDELVEQTFKLKDTRGWKFSESRKELAKDENWDVYFTKILYRPFDVREIYYTQKMVDWPRSEVMSHMLASNLSICFMRQVSLEENYTHFLVSEYMVDNRTFLSSKGIIQQAPLYLYPDTDKKDLFSHKKETEKREPNINPELFKTLSEVYLKELSPEEIFYYIYAVLYSNIYRTKYAEFLKIDFPRVPFTKDYKLFSKMGEYGKRLVDLHLLKSPELDPPVAKFQGKGENRIEKLRYAEKENRAYINQSQYFEGITKEVWEYQIGGYQVCDKWLKDRKGRTLDDIRTYCRIATAIQKTIEIQKAIDGIYTEAERETVLF